MPSLATVLHTRQPYRQRHRRAAAHHCSAATTAGIGRQGIARRLAELVGFAHQELGVSPEELVASLRTILDAALRAVRQIPEAATSRTRALRKLVRTCST